MILLKMVTTTLLGEKVLEEELKPYKKEKNLVKN